MKDLNILIVGVGGQGTLLASVLLGNIALEKGYDVKLSEVHGMAQRGGSVVTHVRISENTVASPIIDEGEADVILAFEMLEGYRYVPYLKKGGTMFINRQEINPMPVIIGATKYPENLEEYFKANIPGVRIIDALKIALECGNGKAVNIALLGALSTSLPFEEKIWIEQIEKNVKAAFVDLNKKAFQMGREAKE